MKHSHEDPLIDMWWTVMMHTRTKRLWTYSWISRKTRVVEGSAHPFTSIRVEHIEFVTQLNNELDEIR